MEFKPVKGTRDFLPGSMKIRDKVISLIEQTFLLYGFEKWDGPSLEYLETLTRKSGSEIEKEIYVFEDKAKRKIGLRFELTTSLARMIATHQNLKLPIRCYSYGKVWRYESPQKGRYREFLQMDADIIGSYSLLCEVELLSMAVDSLKRLGFDDFVIYLNNRKILEGIIELSNINKDKKYDVFRSLDKLSKIGLEGVKKEFINRGLTLQDFEKIINYVDVKGTNQEKLNQMLINIKNSKVGLEGIEEIKKILEYAKILNLESMIILDFTLVRGLDYYTSNVFEIKVKGKEEYGSIAGGGRYDNLIELFGKRSVPAVGFSFGIERIFDIIQHDDKLLNKYKEEKKGVVLIYLDKSYISYVLSIAKILRSKNIPVDFDLNERSIKKQLQYGTSKNFRYALFIGEDEIKNKEFTLKDLTTGNQIKLTINKLIDYLTQS